jgi:hypothetical protein
MAGHHRRAYRARRSAGLLLTLSAARPMVAARERERRRVEGILVDRAVIAALEAL